MRKLTEEEKRLAVAASGGAVIGVVLTMVAVRLFGAPGAVRSSTRAPES